VFPPTRLGIKRGFMATCLRFAATGWMFGCCLTIAVVHFAVSPASGGQTRDLCEKCCRSAGLDEYYFEQCKLKCFRNPDHCLDRKPMNPPTAPPQAASPQQATPQRVIPPTQEAPPVPPTAVTQPIESAPRTSRPSKKEVAFRWPESLIMAPGKEWEAAGQILMANGMAPQHPNFPLAVKAVESVLVDFARRNPTGGDLPTDQLERILMQYR
jgi:hypothetical protein